MASRQFELTTHWRLAAAPEKVWDRILGVSDWPQWWPSVRRVEALKSGTVDGVGAVHRFHWKTALPYDFTFDMELTRVEPGRLIEGRAFGELEGLGTWTLAQDDGGACATYDWRVDVTKPWMRTLAPALKPVFAWNHRAVMRNGEAGLARLLASEP